MAATTTVRVNKETHLRLQELAREAGVTMPELVARLVAADWQQQLFDRADETYAALQADTGAWEATLADGLVDDVSSDQDHPTTATEPAQVPPVPPSRGDVWLVDLDPPRGHEQGGADPP